MALLKLSGLVQKISGKVGGSLFGSSSNGSYLKNNSYSQQRNTQAQGVQRNKIIQASQSWRSLTQAQKDAWALAVINYPYTNRIGEPSYYSNFQLFQFINQNNFQNGFPILSSPPPFVAVINANWSIVINPSSQLIMTTPNGVSSTTVQVWVSPQMPPGITPKASLYRLLGSYPVIGGSQSFGVQSAYELLFGMLVNGNFVYAKVKTIVTNNGNSAGFSTPKFEEIHGQ